MLTSPTIKASGRAGAPPGVAGNDGGRLYPLTPEMLAALQALNRSRQAHAPAPPLQARELARLLLGQFIGLEGKGSYRLLQRGRAALLGTR